MSVRTLQLENEMKVSAPIDKVWRAMMTEQLKWYPHSYGQDRLKGSIFEERLGGLVGEDWGDGKGYLYGTISHWDPPVSYTQQGTLGNGISLEQTTTLEEVDGFTIVKSRMVAFGDISEDFEGQIRFHGDMGNYEDQLKAYVE